MNVNYQNCPSYWLKIGVDKIISITKGEGAEIAVFENCIFAQHFSFKTNRITIVDECSLSMVSASKETMPKLEQQIKYKHGTSVCGAMIGRYNKCSHISTNKVIPNEISCGIAPKAKIKAFTDPNFVHRVKEYLNHYKVKHHVIVDGHPVFPQIDRAKVFVVSTTGNAQYSDGAKAIFSGFLSELCQANGVYIVTSGNDHKNLTNENLLPVTMQDIPDCKKFYDPLIRVAHIYYDDHGIPQINPEANYGRIIDILAPGTDLPLPVPSVVGRIQKDGSILYQPNPDSTKTCERQTGSSFAEPIVAGLAALLLKCNKALSASSIKEAILNNADEYTHLNEFANRGRVINIEKTVQKVCFPNNLDQQVGGDSNAHNDEL